MAKNITASGATVIAAQAGAIYIQVNSALTGTIIVTAAGSNQYGTASQTIATINNPSVGSFYKYGGLHGQGAISVNPSATCDITVTVLSRIS